MTVKNEVNSHSCDDASRFLVKGFSFYKSTRKKKRRGGKGADGRRRNEEKNDKKSAPPKKTRLSVNTSFVQRLWLSAVSALANPTSERKKTGSGLVAMAHERRETTTTAAKRDRTTNDLRRKSIYESVWGERM